MSNVSSIYANYVSVKIKTKNSLLNQHLKNI